MDLHTQNDLALVGASEGLATEMGGQLPKAGETEDLPCPQRYSQSPLDFGVHMLHILA